MHKKLILGVALALGSGAAVAQDYGLFDTWDTDDDGLIGATEFTEGFYDAGYFDTWDTNDDGCLSEDEFGDIGTFDAGLWDTWGTNEDGCLGEEEVATGVFGYYDEDEDAHWEEGEFDDAGDAGLFDV